MKAWQYMRQQVVPRTTMACSAHKDQYTDTDHPPRSRYRLRFRLPVPETGKSRARASDNDLASRRLKLAPQLLLLLPPLGLPMCPRKARAMACDKMGSQAPHARTSCPQRCVCTLRGGPAGHE